MKAALKSPVLAAEASSDYFQKVAPADLTQIGELMYDSFLGTIDYEGETLEDAISEVVEVFKGKYGAVINDACLCVKENEVIISAVVFTWHERENMPLLAFTMTRSSHKGRGFAKNLLRAGFSELFGIGHAQCCLVVTKGNEPAMSIYKSFGFVEET